MSEIVDFSGPFATSEYMEGGILAWTIDRNRFPFRALSVHHYAGDYVAGLERTMQQERAEIVALARDHNSRFGIGPGYRYVAFAHSGRIYKVGRDDTRRAAVRYWNQASGNPWNIDIDSLAFVGDWDADNERTRAGGHEETLRFWLAEMERKHGRKLPVFGHRQHELWNVHTRQVVANSTACPGRFILDALERIEIDSRNGEDSGMVTASAETYTVEPGDTLSAIALRFLGDAGRYRELLIASGYTPDYNPRLLAVGTVLTIPPKDAPKTSSVAASDAERINAITTTARRALQGVAVDVSARIDSIARNAADEIASILRG